MGEVEIVLDKCGFLVAEVIPGFTGKANVESVSATIGA
jgi:hypothetical protein